MTSENKKPFVMSRRRRNRLIVISVIFIALLVLLDHSPVSFRKLGTFETESTPGGDYQRYHSKSFEVANVVDGDTIDIDVPDGDKVSTRIRLWGVDTPETHQGADYFGAEAAEFVKKTALGETVTLYLEEHRTRGYYGRLLAYVQLPGGEFLNEVLVQEGYAYADVRFRHSFYGKYKKLQSAARREAKGLWAGVKREQLPDWLQKREPDLLRK